MINEFQVSQLIICNIISEKYILMNSLVIYFLVCIFSFDDRVYKLSHYEHLLCSIYECKICTLHMVILL